jgi:hypothetical protein
VTIVVHDFGIRFADVAAHTVGGYKFAYDLNTISSFLYATIARYGCTEKSTTIEMPIKSPLESLPSVLGLLISLTCHRDSIQTLVHEFTQPQLCRNNTLGNTRHTGACISHRNHLLSN